MNKELSIRLIRRATTVCLLLLVVASCGGSPTTSFTELAVKNAWVRPTPQGATVAAVYLIIESPSDEEVSLISTDVAKAAMIHATTSDDEGGHSGHGHGGGGSMSMVEATAEITANRPMVMSPGGLHIMLEGVVNPLQEGETFTMTIEFVSGAKKSVDVVVSTNSPFRG